MVIVVGHIQIPLVTPKLSGQDSVRQILDRSGLMEGVTQAILLILDRSELMEGVTQAILFWDPNYTDVDDGRCWWRCYK
jgi:hypothetical protein